MKNKIKIIIADDHEITRSGIKLLLSYQFNFEVVGEANNGVQAIKIAKELNPDIAILDIQMPDKNGIEAAKEIRKINSDIKIVLLTALNDDHWIDKALEVGADGYIVKDIGEDDIITALKKIHNGNRVFCRSVLKYIETKKVSAVKSDSKPVSFTKREQEVLNLIADGNSNVEIADILNLSDNTINIYCSKLKNKARAGSRAALIKFAIQNMQS